MKQKFFNFNGYIEVALKLGSAAEASKLASESLATAAKDEDYPNQVYINGNEVHLLWDDFSWPDAKYVVEELSDEYTILEYKQFNQ